VDCTRTIIDGTPFCIPHTPGDINMDMMRHIMERLSDLMAGVDPGVVSELGQYLKEVDSRDRNVDVNQERALSERVISALEMIQRVGHTTGVMMTHLELDPSSAWAKGGVD
jgi:hypothetical protein